MAGLTRKALVAEDSLPGRVALEKLLNALGFQVLFAGSGREAISLFIENADTALILMDIRMPNLNGIKATQEIRLSGGAAGMKVPIVESRPPMRLRCAGNAWHRA